VFLNTVFSFLAVAAVVFFFVVRPCNDLTERMAKAELDGADETPAPPEDIDLLREIRDALPDDRVAGARAPSYGRFDGRCR
jgi:large conductance mechanosensitive channel